MFNPKFIMKLGISLHEILQRCCWWCPFLLFLLGARFISFVVKHILLEVGGNVFNNILIGRASEDSPEIM